MAATDLDIDALTRQRQRIRARYLRSSTPPSRARGIHHAALISSDVRRTVEFYQDLLEFPLTEMFENRDLPGSTHFFFDVGNGNQLAYFDLPGVPVGEYAEVLGGKHHIALSVTPQNWDYLRAKLDDAGIAYDIRSGVSIYFHGPDGERLELISDPLGELYGTTILH
ncbi:MAG: VOC family protein [Nocardia sp.]|nr:VOC family protein [Nocardia sp.]